MFKLTRHSFNALTLSSRQVHFDRFTRALGLRCQFGHVGEEGMPLEKFDFAANAKPGKQMLYPVDSRLGGRQLTLLN